ncbi:MAG: hypothetical protein KJ884_13885 [Gammaproteobacteria bacterium]|nr:hypothetical protein [Gammaproteobacteria bacterium]MBU1488656.1 hypothetical protein [Gammaproteobacteria bacterium]MBU2064316.1 hypothetical protein [Gammaproteobacteria bacterium]MBU2140415.1 hypothetical protein [Gammaproteobacteria bacterium]MBU2218092.1 hypothetical protein [Gammaproteobacteria bacterium]
MYRPIPHLLNARALLAATCLIGLLWLANRSQSPADALGLFAFSAFVSLGFLLFGQQRFARPPTNAATEDQHIA